MTIKLKYSDVPIEVTGMSFDEDGVFKGYFKEGDPAAPVKTDEFYPKEDCAATGDLHILWSMHILEQRQKNMLHIMDDILQIISPKDGVKIVDDDNIQ